MRILNKILLMGLSFGLFACGDDNSSVSSERSEESLSSSSIVDETLSSSSGEAEDDFTKWLSPWIDSNVIPKRLKLEISAFSV